MNPIALYFASGESFYPGVALLFTLVVASSFLQRHGLGVWRNLAVWVAVILIVMASPPFAWAVDAIFVMSFLIWVFAPMLRSKQSLIPGMLFMIVLVILTWTELNHRKLPKLLGERAEHIAVIGDSISSGIGSRVAAWPTVLHQTTGLGVKNFAKPGAGTMEALEMADQLTQDDRLVLLEIGGNDLLEGASSVGFQRNLEMLIRKIAEPGREIVMFELPLIPTKVSFGQVQRRLAKQYGILLIPRRFFVDVISGANATTDGLHLSETGAKRMASLVQRMLTE